MKRLSKDPQRFDLRAINKTKEDAEVAVVANDFHFPFQDSRIVRLWLAFMEDIQPHHIIINGDLLDCFALSKFDKDPRRMVRFKRELEMGEEFFAKLRELFPQTHIVYVFGNHEFRLQAYIIRQCADLIDLEGLSIEDQMHLDKYDVEVVSSGLKESYYRYGDIYISHFNKVSQHGAYTAKLLLDQKGVSLIQGHTHRMGDTFRTHLDRKVLGGWDNGCMCDLHPHYVLGPNWQHGWTVIFKEKNDGRFNVQQVGPIIKYKFRFGRTLYSG